MIRVSHITQATDLFGAGKHGYQSGQVATMTPATVLQSEAMNHLQEEVCNVVESAGITLSSSNYGQLLCAVLGAVDFQALVSITPRTAGSAYSSDFADVIYAGSQYVAVGFSGGIQTSPDGVTWTARTADSAYAGSFAAVEYNGSNLYCAVGSSGAIQTSPDGVTWTSRTAGSGFASFFTDVIYVSSLGLWVAVGSNQEIQTSPDGITWTRRSTGVGSNLPKVAFGNGTIVSAGSDSTLVSTNGTTWTAGANRSCSELIYAHSLFIAAHNTGVAYSADGLAWSTGLGAVFGEQFLALTSNGRSVFAVGASGRTAISQDGKQWLFKSKTWMPNYTGLAFDSTGYCVLVGTAGSIRQTTVRVA